MTWGTAVWGSYKPDTMRWTKPTLRWSSRRSHSLTAGCSSELWRSFPLCTDQENSVFDLWTSGPDTQQIACHRWRKTQVCPVCTRREGEVIGVDARQQDIFSHQTMDRTTHCDISNTIVVHTLTSQAVQQWCRWAAYQERLNCEVGSKRRVTNQDLT